ncbi:Ecp39 [Fulvia fulva]|uniref:Ecp39 n=1 Tax=Passalora fulva TaxID=5499 RepID=A0A1P8YY19_PASFU|nr:Ecp39 [Fulvia fulva]AQA29245.1 extracellular protein 39 [Fulvia fulva]KAK4621979.1 Ecp39 [Fulvia fulva]KAK4622678.1 Ecp39 [Fulvia fulva]UJO19516.1 Ecp39 [Fulvia fulva]WPV16103.1 Ecp39 [Fulvia fulva]
MRFVTIITAMIGFIGFTVAELGCDSQYCPCRTACNGDEACRTSCYNGHCANTFGSGTGGVPSC